MKKLKGIFTFFVVFTVVLSTVAFPLSVSSLDMDEVTANAYTAFLPEAVKSAGGSSSHIYRES